MLQRQLLNYQINQLYQNSLRQNSAAGGVVSSTTQQKIGKIASFKEPGSTLLSTDTRPSVYNRRISSEQMELPDGRVCTRVPARKWSKVIFFTRKMGWLFLSIFSVYNIHPRAFLNTLERRPYKHQPIKTPLFVSKFWKNTTILKKNFLYFFKIYFNKSQGSWFFQIICFRCLTFSISTKNALKSHYF